MAWYLPLMLQPLIFGAKLLQLFHHCFYLFPQAAYVQPFHVPTFIPDFLISYFNNDWTAPSILSKTSMMCFNAATSFSENCCVVFFPSPVLVWTYGWDPSSSRWMFPISSLIFITWLSNSFLSTFYLRSFSSYASLLSKSSDRDYCWTMVRLLFVWAVAELRSMPSRVDWRFCSFE